MTREEMLIAIIHILGFEHPATIRFATACETTRDERALIARFKIIMTRIQKGSIR